MPVLIWYYIWKIVLVPVITESRLANVNLKYDHLYIRISKKDSSFPDYTILGLQKVNTAGMFCDIKNT